MSNGFAGVCNINGHPRPGPFKADLTFCLRMIFSENRFPSPIGVEDMLFGIMRYVRCADLRRDCRESTAASKIRRGITRISRLASLLARPGMTTRWPRIRPR
jgi:hypothetical protein